MVPNSGGPDVTLAFKVAYEVLPGIAVGPEYYDTLGQTSNIVAPSQRDRVLFLAFDVARGWVPFNFRIGRGLDAASDRWTLKAILEMPLS